MPKQNHSRDNQLRIMLFIITAGFHAGLIFFVAFRVAAPPPVEEPLAGVMRLVDVQEELPPPPPPRDPPPVVQNTAEAIAETMIETDLVPDEIITVSQAVTMPAAREEAVEYLAMSKISVLPKFDEEKIRRATVYPAIALRSNIEGTVYLELFVDARGDIREIQILRESPEGRGFGEAAVNAFRGISGEPAQSNGRAVAVRYRYPVRFTIK
jgi:protein TonB